MQNTHVGLYEVRPVRHEILRVGHVPPLFHPDEVLHGVQALLQAGGGQEVLHRHAVAEEKRHRLKLESSIVN